MTLGGGTFTSYNKIFPGAYVNTITLGQNLNLFGERGYVAAPMALSWGASDGYITVTADDFPQDALRLFGFTAKAPELADVRELLKGASTVLVPRLDTGGLKAENTFFTALCAGERGNALKTVIQLNASATETDLIYDVITYFDTVIVGRQAGVRSMADVRANQYAEPKADAVLAETAGTPFTGGTDGTVTIGDHLEALNRLDAAYFNVLVCASSEAEIKAMYEEFTVDKNTNQGIKFQTVCHRYAVDNKYIISVENNSTPELCYWVGGKSAGVPIGMSLTNQPYDGALTVAFDDEGMSYIHDDYSRFIEEGRFALYNDGGTPRIIMDINSKTTVTDAENEWFKDNQTVRIMQQSAEDKARIFNTLFLGRVPNDEAGRLSLWNRFTSYNSDFLQSTNRAITNYSANDTEVFYIDKKVVGCREALETVNAMEKLFITTVFI